jgi:ubiquinone/menaquinone biosynthesis C-methylase UbiE
MKESNFELYEKLPENLWWIQTRNDLIKKLLQKHLKNKNAKILDLGCGTGFNYNSISEFGDCYGLDISKSAIEQAKKFKYKKLITGNALKTRIKENTFDAVLCMDLIEHVEKDDELLNEVKRILKKEGICLFTVPAYKFLWSKDDELACHLRRYTLKQIKTKIKNLGFEIKLLSYRYFFIFLPTILLFMFQKFKKNSNNSLNYSPKKGIMNKILYKMMNFENKIISKKISFPFGIGIVGVIKKKNE